VGIVLGGLGFLKAVIVGAIISTFAEGSQFFMVHRVPSAIAFVSNVIGTMIGALISTHWRPHSPELRIGNYKAALAAAMAAVLIVGVWASSGDVVNARGASSPGTLEACWKSDKGSGRVALDSFGHKLHGSFPQPTETCPV
jgi:hypothetical protein